MNRLFVFLEGADDIRFFEGVLKKQLRKGYASVELISYAGMKHIRVDGFIRGIGAMGDDYLMVADIDNDRNVKAKKQRLKRWYQELDTNKVIVVIKEIEGWYLAGLDDTHARSLGLRPLIKTDRVTKETFNRMIPDHYGSRIDLMIEIIKRYSIQVAQEKNRSFRFFYWRCLE
jgi:hypothetical protein